jgi:hypothetical protein
MVGSAKQIWSLIAALVAAATFAAAGVASSPGTSTTARIPTLYVMYAMNCTFTFQNDQGQTVTTIPPGAYEVDVRTPVAFGTVPLLGSNDLTACHGAPMFQMTGPGVNLFTTMTAGCSVDLLFPETFQASASYTAEDLNQPSVTKSTLSIAATGSAVTPPPITVTGVKGETQQQLIGSDSNKGKPKATLIGVIEANGTLTLMLKGKPVSTLAAGRYTFAITDKDPKGSFTLLGPTSKSASNLTGVKYVGTESKIVNLNKVGRWQYSVGSGSTHYLTITK